MIYFTKKILSDCDNLDSAVSAELWKKTCNNYNSYFELNIKRKLPNDFLKFYSRERFHDSIIRYVVFSRTAHGENMLSLFLQSDYAGNFCIDCIGVKKICGKLLI